MKDNLIKTYFYLNQGVGILNNFRNLFLAIFAVYFALKLNHPAILVLMFLIAIPILTIMGYYNVHKIAKRSEELTTKYGTHYGIKQFELIEEIRDLMKKYGEKIN